MNVKELVIKGTDKIVAYSCGRCWMVHKDADRAERCCPSYVCRYCGEVTPPFRMVCETCGEISLAARAKHVPWSEYTEAMVCIDGDDRYISTEDIDEAIEEGDITLPFVWGCTPIVPKTGYSGPIFAPVYGVGEIRLTGRKAMYI